MNHKVVNTSQEAWEYMNEYIFTQESKLKKLGAGREGNSSFSYDNLIYINKAWVDPNFDFAKVLDYKKQKWSHLVNNYLDLNHLDIIKAEILSYEKSKKRTYNISFQFSNYHGSGKGCLLSLTFSRRISSDIPILIFNTRATEVTRRLLIDFLLIQRIGEYIYGLKQTLSIIFYAPMAYIHCESYLYYLHYNGKKIIRDTLKSKLPFHNLVKNTYNKYLTCNPKSITYTSHQRIATHLQRGHGDLRKMLSSELTLDINKTINYPEDCLTDRQRSEFRKSLK